MVGERVAEHDDEIEHHRQVERGDQQARDGEARERHARPAARHERDEDHAGHEAAERDEREHVALEHVGKAVQAAVDRVPPQPGQMARAGADAVKGEIAHHHAAVDAGGDEPDRHEVVHYDVGAEHDGEILVRERQHDQ